MRPRPDASHRKPPKRRISLFPLSQRLAAWIPDLFVSHQGSASVHQRSLTGLLSQQVQGINAGAEVQGRHPMASVCRNASSRVIPLSLPPRTFEPSPPIQPAVQGKPTNLITSLRCNRSWTMHALVLQSLEVSLPTPTTSRPSFRNPCPYRRGHPYAATDNRHPRDHQAQSSVGVLHLAFSFFD
jgi:hypothetical protein